MLLGKPLGSIARRLRPGFAPVALPPFLETPRKTDPVAVVSRRGADGKFHPIRRFNRWFKGDPQTRPAVEDVDGR